MRDCYVANTAPKAKANKYVVGEKKSFQDLIIDGKQAKARELAPKVFLTEEEKANKKRQSTRESRSRKKQRNQAACTIYAPERKQHMGPKIIVYAPVSFLVLTRGDLAYYQRWEA